MIEERKGRKTAASLKLKYSGTLGLILNAKQLGKIKSIKPLVNVIRKTNFRISENLLIILLKEAGE
ncbi:DUF3368 domain-containing protein [Belliella pelovolcani]|uniref:DUF3368 domain-containing protein n=1 Tax=Belliella pelovolcani TaxID=529505 RepID=UPI00391B3AE0